MPNPAHRPKLQSIGPADPGLAPKKRRSRRRFRRVIGLLAGAALLAAVVPLVLWARYRVAYVVSRNAIVRGYISDVGAQLSGVVKSIEVDAGQKVKAGQVLARFEDGQLVAQVARARSQLERATRALEIERLSITHEDKRLASLVSEASARVAAAQAQSTAARTRKKDAEDRFTLRRSLADAGVVTQEELRSAETVRQTSAADGETAAADEKAAEAAHRLAEVERQGLSVREQHLVVMEAEIAACKAELELAEADLRATLIRAPEDGWVIRRIVQPGGSVSVGQPVVSLWLGNSLWVETWIDEDDLAQLGIGSPAKVNVKPFPGRDFAGVVEMIGVSTDYELPTNAVPQPRNERMRTAPVVSVRVRLADTQGLFPGLSAVVGIRRK